MTCIGGEGIATGQLVVVLATPIIQSEKYRRVGYDRVTQHRKVMEPEKKGRNG